MVRESLVFLFFLIFSSICYADTRTDQPGVLFGDINGTNAGRYRSVKFSNGSTTNNGDGSVSVSTSGGSSQWTTLGNNIYYSTGNVGIGTSTTRAKLTVGTSLDSPDNASDVYIGSSSVPVLTLRNEGTNAEIYLQASNSNAVIASSPNIDMIFSMNGTDAIHIKPSGNVGINTTGARSLLNVGGNIYIDRTTSTLIFKDSGGGGGCTGLTGNTGTVTASVITCP